MADSNSLKNKRSHCRTKTTKVIKGLYIHFSKKEFCETKSVDFI